MDFHPEKTTGMGQSVSMIYFLIIIVILIALGPRLKNLPYRSPTFSYKIENLEQVLNEQEKQNENLRDGCEKKIFWATEKNKKTQYSVVFIHGWTSSRREMSPVVENIAKHFNANLFMTRLKGHGLGPDDYLNINEKDWLDDTEEALAVAECLGEKVIFIGNSTGASLGVWACHENPNRIHAYIGFSNNFEPANKRSRIILWPWGRWLTYLFLGYFQEQGNPESIRPAQIWSRRYRSDALFPLMLVLKRVNNLDLSKIKTPALLFYSPHDKVIDVDLLKKKFPQIGSSNKKLVELSEAKNHLIAGDIVSPHCTQLVVEACKEWLSKLS